MRVLIFDVETCANAKLVGLALEAARIRAEARKNASGEVDEEGVRAEMALSPIFGKIVAVGLLDVNFAEPHVLIGDDEREILQQFWNLAGSYDLYIGWNSLDFDAPWLTIRSLVNGLQPGFISQARYRHPGETNHLDLYQLLTSWRGNRSRWLRLDLATVARALGVESPQGDGADVPRLWENGDLDAIRAHLESDLRATLAIWQRLGCPGLNPRSPTPSGLPF